MRPADRAAGVHEALPNGRLIGGREADLSAETRVRGERPPSEALRNRL
jgi:hypothetical protein